MKSNETTKLAFNILKPKDKFVPRYSEVARTGAEYVLYGADNRFPQYIWDLYLKSPLMSSIINGTSDFVFGNGITWSPNIKIGENYINSDGDTLDDVVKKIIVDDQLFGGFALKVCRNALGDIADIHWIDFRNIRVNEDETVAYYYPKGFKYNQVKETYPIFSDNESFLTSIYYFKGHITRGIYPVPKYVGALAAIETSTEISKFHLNTIHNNFSGNFIINYNNTDFTEEQKDEIKKGVEDNFTGAENAGRFMLAFNQGKENAVTVARIPEDNFDNKYQALKENTMREIFVAFRAQPQLFGFVIEGSLFNRSDFDEAYSLYNKACVAPAQNDIKRVFNKIFNIEGKDAMNFIPFKLED